MKIFVIFLLSLATFAYCDNRIRYVFYGPGVHDSVVFDVTNFHDILGHPWFDNSRHIVMFHYGEGQTLATPQVFDIVHSYAHTQEFNFVMVDYSSSGTVRPGNAQDLAAGITTNMIGIFDRGYNSGHFSAIGFGLGAHIMARACRHTSSQSQRRHICGRLTGLNPVDLGPINGLQIGRLSATDAQFVETVFTEGNSIVDHESRGHVSFFVNGGMTQPWCQQTFPSSRAECSHIFALPVWAESARTRAHIFPSLLCDSWAEFSGGVCNNNDVTYVGRSTSFDRRGPYFLRTNWVAPYSRNTPFP